jgi:hypothetical protein
MDQVLLILGAFLCVISGAGAAYTAFKKGDPEAMNRFSLLALLLAGAGSFAGIIIIIKPFLG